MNKDMQELLLIRKTLNNESRFNYEEKYKAGYEIGYRMIADSLRNLHIAIGDVAGINDCYILFSLSVLKAADQYTLERFLRAYKNKNKELYIMANDTAQKKDVMSHRLRMLYTNGFILRHRYNKEGISLKEMEYEEELSKEIYGKRVSDQVVREYIFFTIEKSGYICMNQKLRKHVDCISYIGQKPLYELIGLNANANTIVSFIEQSTFFKISMESFTSKYIGVIRMTAELLFKKNGMTYNVAFEPVFWEKDLSIQTEVEYYDMCAYQINLFRNYFGIKGKNNPNVRLVLTVANNKDLLRIADAITRDGNLKNVLPAIYFTSETLIEKMWFLQMYESDNENGYEFKRGIPDFI